MNKTRLVTGIVAALCSWLAHDYIHWASIFFTCCAALFFTTALLGKRWDKWRENRFGLLRKRLK